MSNNIPAGYQLHIHSWENDADSNKVEILSGLTLFDVEFYLEIAHRFTSRNSITNKGFGNGSVSGEDICEMFDTAFINHPHISDNLKAIKIKAEEYEGDYKVRQYYATLCKKILGYPDSDYYCSIDYFCRVFDRFEVFYFPTDIDDVTKQFKK